MQVGRYLGFCVRQIRIFGVLRETCPGYFVFLGRILIDIKKKNFSHDLSPFCFPVFLQFLPGDQIDLSSYMKHVPIRGSRSTQEEKILHETCQVLHRNSRRRLTQNLPQIDVLDSRKTHRTTPKFTNNKKQLCLLLLSSRQLLLA